MEKIICWGTGKQAREVLRYLPTAKYDILYFVDGNKEKWGGNFESYKIMKPSVTISDIDMYEFILITSGYWEEIFEECVKTGICYSKIRYFDIRDFRIKTLDEMYADSVFSQDGEEVYLKGRFKDKAEGLYVDVGAFHPFRYSNTCWAYKRGWRGINIEPNYDNYTLLCALRPEDININCGISNKERMMEYYSLEKGALNTFHFDEIKNKEEIIGIYKVPVKRLDTIFQEYNIKEIEYIDIDVEGMELEVLQSIDWAKVSISSILVEQRKMTIIDVVQSDICIFLKNKGYVPVNKYNRTVIYEKIFI